MNRPRRAAAALAPALAALMLAGCSTLPRERAQAPPLPDQWQEAAAPPQAADLTDWWATFEDPLLDRLIAEGLQASPDVRRAALRVIEARARARQTLTDFLPQLSATGRGEYTQSLEGAPLRGANGAFEDEQAISVYGAQVSWEIPLFARVQSAAVGAGANTRAALADLRGAQVALAADLARAYVDLRAGQSRRAALAESAAVAARLADLLDVSVEAGLAAGADAADARRLAESLRARLPDAEIEIRRAETVLAVLRGKAPGTEPPEVAQALRAPAAPPAPRLAGPPAAPADLLRLRPDIARAENATLVQAAAVGVARSELLPRLTLTGVLGVTDAVTGTAVSGNVTQLQATPAITLPLFGWGQRLAAVRERRAQFESALVDYQDVVSRAVAEASNALTAFDQGARRLDAARAAEAAAERTAFALRRAQEAGLVSLRDRLQADQQLIDARLTRIEAEAAQAGAAIAVYRAFAGGPPTDETAAAVRAAQNEIEG